MCWICLRHRSATEEIENQVKEEIYRRMQSNDRLIMEVEPQDGTEGRRPVSRSHKHNFRNNRKNSRRKAYRGDYEIPDQPE